MRLKRAQKCQSIDLQVLISGIIDTCKWFELLNFHLPQLSLMSASIILPSFAVYKSFTTSCGPLGTLKRSSALPCWCRVHKAICVHAKIFWPVVLWQLQDPIMQSCRCPLDNVALQQVLIKNMLNLSLFPNIATTNCRRVVFIASLNQDKSLAAASFTCSELYASSEPFTTWLCIDDTPFVFSSSRINSKQACCYYSPWLTIHDVGWTHCSTVKFSLPIRLNLEPWKKANWRFLVCNVEQLQFVPRL